MSVIEQIAYASMLTGFAGIVLIVSAVLITQIWDKPKTKRRFK